MIGPTSYEPSGKLLRELARDGYTIAIRIKLMKRVRRVTCVLKRGAGTTTVGLDYKLDQPAPTRSQLDAFWSAIRRTHEELNGPAKSSDGSPDDRPKGPL